jgi:photosystem II stability/assembly factor-like uncharacterized protein
MEALPKKHIKHSGIVLLILATALPLTGCDQTATTPPGGDCPSVSRSAFGKATADSSEWQYLGLSDERIGDIVSVAVQPNDPDVIFAGSSYDFSAGILGKLFRSTDGGTTWDTLIVGKPGESFTIIQFDPNDPETIYTTPRDLIKSTDGGDTWSHPTNDIRVDSETRVASFAINPLNTDVLYAGTGGFHGGTLYKSTDGGENWTELISDNQRMSRSGVISLAITPNDSGTVYAGTGDVGEVFKSTDAGETWKMTGLGTTESIISDLLVNPGNPTEIYAAYGKLAQSNNSGETWQSFDSGLPKEMEAVRMERTRTGRLFLITTYKDTGGIYEWSTDDSAWSKVGIEALEQSYYYSSIDFSEAKKKLYVGLDGVYARTFTDTGIESPPCSF